MPLLPGKKNIGHNIEEMQESGHSHEQSVAAALNKARKSGAKIPKKYDGSRHDGHKEHHEPKHKRKHLRAGKYGT